MPRSSWSGYLKLSLVSVPVKAYTASNPSGKRIALNQLHDECHSRIRYQKVCPIHGEVSQDQIVSGYEYSKGQYVVIDPSELDKLRTQNDKSITIDAVVNAGEIDPVYYTDRTYYLLPDGAIGHKPYNLILKTLEDQRFEAVARVVLSNRESLVLLRPYDHVLTMTVLSYKNEIKESAGFRDEIVPTDLSDQEVKLTRQLIEGMKRDAFDLGEYHDEYTEKLTMVIEAKVAGKEIVSQPAAEEPGVINLMDALKASVQRVKPPRKQKAAPAAEKPAKPPKRKAPSARTRSTGKAAGKKKKSG